MKLLTEASCYIYGFRGGIIKMIDKQRVEQPKHIYHNITALKVMCKWNCNIIAASMAY